MAGDYGAECRQFRARIGRAGRVAGAVQDHEPRARRDRSGELGGGDLETLFLAGRDNHRRAVREQHHVRIGHPVGRRDDHLVAGIEQRAAQVEDRLLGAVRHQDLRARVLETVVAAELADDRVAQLDGALDRGVTGVAGADRRDARLGNMGGRVEVRLAGAQADDVLALGLAGPHGRSRRGSGRA